MDPWIMDLWGMDGWVSAGRGHIGLLLCGERLIKSRTEAGVGVKGGWQIPGFSRTNRHRSHVISSSRPTVLWTHSGCRTMPQRIHGRHRPPSSPQRAQMSGNASSRWSEVLPYLKQMPSPAKGGESVATSGTGEDEMTTEGVTLVGWFSGVFLTRGSSLKAVGVSLSMSNGVPGPTSSRPRDVGETTPTGAKPEVLAISAGDIEWRRLPLLHELTTTESPRT